MAVTLEDDSDPTLTHFAHRDELLSLLQRLRSVNLDAAPSNEQDVEEEELLSAIGAILDYYLPLPGLLDPSLNDIVTPLLEDFSKALTKLEQGGHLDSNRFHRLGRAINWVVKARGWKGVVRQPPIPQRLIISKQQPLTSAVPYFPSEIRHLPILVNLLSPSSNATSSTTCNPHHHPILSTQDAWETRAVLLLWLALLLTVPFNLQALSEDSARIENSQIPHGAVLLSGVEASLARQVISICVPLLSKPGKEGSYAGLVLARLYSRTDAVEHLPKFLEWIRLELEEGDREGEAIFVASLLGFLSLLPTMVPHHHLEHLEGFWAKVFLPHLRGSRTAAGSALVRKLAVKSRGRWWMAKLGKQKSTGDLDDSLDGLEDQLDELMNGLSDKDTIVRYSCAKYLARLTSVLPLDFGSQLVSATIDLFAGTEDEPVLTNDYGQVVDPGGNASVGGTMGFGGAETTKGEARWHGCCLALAEMARRGLVKEDEATSQTVAWALKALTFDLRRSSHSVGANVRDAAAYLLWSLSRACDTAFIAPFASDLATTLISVACLDREVGVRRAASAAFQEGVGRLGLYPHGIDVLAKTDFFSVSIRRIAFTVGVSGVSEHPEYRAKLRLHLHHITLRHWDLNMRALAAHALRIVVNAGSLQDLQDSLDGEIAELSSLDTASTHGALLGLTELASLLSLDDQRRQSIINAITTIRPIALVSQHAPDILQSASHLLRATLAPANVNDDTTQKLIEQYLDNSSKRRESECHQPAAELIGRVTELQDGSDLVKKLLANLKSMRAAQRQSAALALGYVDYRHCAASVSKVVAELLAQLDPKAKADVETRRSSIDSLARILNQSSLDGEHLLVNETEYRLIVSSFITALDDYSTDQRGDVGSWVRMAGVAALEQAVSRARSLGAAQALQFLPQNLFLALVTGIVKQGVEKLEPVRAAVWRAWRTLSKCHEGSDWQWEGQQAWDFEMSDTSIESFRYIEVGRWYSSAMPLLRTSYRESLLKGLIHSIGSQVESLAGVVWKAFSQYLEPNLNQQLCLGILSDLQGILASNINLNRVFIPTVVTVTKFLSLSGIRDHVMGDPELVTCLSKIIAIACRGVPQIKSIERISASMKLVITANCYPQGVIRDKAISNLPPFLGHQFPRIRSTCAEALYLALSEEEDEMSPELEEALLEPSWTESGVGAEAAAKVVTSLKESRS